MKYIIPSISIFISFLAAMLFTGCATTYSNANDSDLPWNTPQPWEASPSIPGLDRQD